MTSGIINLKHRYSMSGYCSIPQANWPLPLTEDVEEVECRLLNNEEIFNHNYYVWTLSVFIGCQFTHLSRSSFLGSFDFVGNIFKRWPLRNYFIMAGLVALVAYSFAQIFELYSAAGVLWFYLGFLFLLVLGIFLEIKCVYSIDEFHLHHYQLGLLLAFFTAFQTPFIGCLNGLGSGIMLDGGSSYDWDPMFEEWRAEDANAETLP